jgi:hypothetical protein
VCIIWALRGTCVCDYVCVHVYVCGGEEFTSSLILQYELGILLRICFGGSS